MEIPVVPAIRVYDITYIDSYCPYCGYENTRKTVLTKRFLSETCTFCREEYNINALETI